LMDIVESHLLYAKLSILFFEAHLQKVA